MLFLYVVVGDGVSGSVVGEESNVAASPTIMFAQVMFCMLLNVAHFTLLTASMSTYSRSFEFHSKSNLLNSCVVIHAVFLFT
jgi:hypothetical protein